jgi:hypothetical protein
MMPGIKMESAMKVVTVSVSKHSSKDRSYTHDAWALMGQNEHHWFVKCLTQSFSWSEKPVVFLEKQYYDIFDVQKNISDLVIADYRKRNPIQESECQKTQKASIHTKNSTPFLSRIPGDEPIFILRAQDKLAHHFVRQWVAVASAKGLSQERANEALVCAAEMEAWPVKKLLD